MLVGEGDGTRGEGARAPSPKWVRRGEGGKGESFPSCPDELPERDLSEDEDETLLVFSGASTTTCSTGNVDGLMLLRRSAFDVGTPSPPSPKPTADPTDPPGVCPPLPSDGNLWPCPSSTLLRRGGRTEPSNDVDPEGRGSVFVRGVTARSGDG